MSNSIGTKRLELFVRDRYNDCLKMAIKYSNCRADAEDSLQESFINAFQHIDTYNTAMPFDRWFIRVLINTCLTQVRKPFRTKEVSFTAVEHYWPNIDTSLLEGDDFDTILVNKMDIEEKRHILYEAMKILNDGQLDLLLIAYGRETPSETIAGWYGITTVAVDCRLTRIRQALRKRVQEIITSSEEATDATS